MVTSADSSELGWLTPEALVDFIDGLREAGYNIGVSQYIAAQDLVLAIATQGDGLDHPHRLKTLLGPILCSTPYEQADFRHRFDAWIHLIDAAAKPVKPAPLEQEFKQVERRSRRVQRILLYSTLVLVGLLGSVLVSHWFSEIIAPGTDLPAPSVEPALPAIDIRALLNQLLLAIGLIEMIESNLINWRVALALIILIPGLALGIWWVWWQRQARQFLQRRATDQPPELDKISIPESDQSLFPSALFVQIARQLRRRISIPSNDIDIEKTMQASLRQGGWLTPVYGDRKVLPEYLFLIDRSSYRDHQARFVQEAIARLQQNDVFITGYTFDGDPRICFPFNDKDAPLRLTELAAKYSQHRLLIFVEADQLFRSDTGHIAPWTETLTRWQDRVVLTPKAIEQWGYPETELTEQFVVLPATVQGLQVLIQSLQQGKTTLIPEASGRVPLPDSLRLHPRRWIARNPPPSEQIHTMLLDLQQYLGAESFHWFSACAIFPKLHWNLTVFLGNALKTEEGLSLLEASSINDLARLPWFRYGYMPDWLRTNLIATLTLAQEQTIRQKLQALLLTAVQGEETGGFQLEIVHQHSNLVSRLAKPMMKRLSKQAPTNSALKDYIFMDFLLERNRQALAVELPGEIREVLNRGEDATATWRRLTRKLLVESVVFAIVIGLLIGFIFNWITSDFRVTDLLGSFLIGFSIRTPWILRSKKLLRIWDWLFCGLLITVAIILYDQDALLNSPKILAYMGITLVNIILFLNAIHFRILKAQKSNTMKQNSNK